MSSPEILQKYAKLFEKKNIDSNFVEKYITDDPTKKINRFFCPSTIEPPIPTCIMGLTRDEER